MIYKCSINTYGETFPFIFLFSIWHHQSLPILSVCFSLSYDAKQGSQDLLPQYKQPYSIFRAQVATLCIFFNFSHDDFFCMDLVSFPGQQILIRNITIIEVQQALVLKKECVRVFIASQEGQGHYAKITNFFPYNREA